jgi:alpha-1,3-mannosyltransferase
LPEDIFLSKPLAATLLLMHIGFLIALAIRWIRATCQQTRRAIFLGKRLDSHYIVYTMLVSNFIGIAFARTLHYQFYCWYFHALPYILWAGDGNRLPNALCVVVLLGVESSFLTFPATPLSSAVLQSCHMLILLQIRPPSCVAEEAKAKNT